jgi:hypothetical protein
LPLTVSVFLMLVLVVCIGMVGAGGGDVVLVK